MDYDRYDAFLHHIFKQTQGDAWFRQNEDSITPGVALRVSEANAAGQPEFRVFPYENLALEPFEAAAPGQTAVFLGAGDAVVGSATIAA